MDGYGIPNSFENEEANKNIHPDAINDTSSPQEKGFTEYTGGDFNTGNFGNGYSYGYPYGATITSDYGYTYETENLNNSGYSYDEYTDNPGSSEYSGNEKNTDTSGYSNNTNSSGNTDPSDDFTDSNGSGGSGSSGEAPPENDLKHMVDIMKAALPHLDSTTQESASLIIKTSELMDTFQTVRNNEHVSAFSFSRQNIDLEALLTSIRNVCYARERQIIDSILSFLRMKTMFETYSALSSMMTSQPTDGGNYDSTGNNESTEAGGSGFNPNMMDILSTMLTPEQKSTFDNISMMFNMMQE